MLYFEALYLKSEMLIVDLSLYGSSTPNKNLNIDTIESPSYQGLSLFLI